MNYFNELSCSVRVRRIGPRIQKEDWHVAQKVA